MTARSFVLFDQQTGAVRDYPRVDDDPVQGLDPRYAVLRVVREPAPEVLPGQQASQTRTVDLEAGEWRWGWSVVDLPEPAPPADWRTFKRTLLSHPAINALLGGGVSTAPAAALSLPATLLAAAGGGDVDDFRAAWLGLRRLGLVSAELLQEVRGLAIALHLPDGFVAALGGSLRPAAASVGQEWVDAAGDLWVVVQARGEDGQFASDDPATPSQESLIWERV
jgi:hypothetical protein